MLLLIIIFTALLIVAAIGFSVNLKRRRTLFQTETLKEIEPPAYRSLFAPTDEENAVFEREEKEKMLAERSQIVRQNLIARADDGDFTVLTEITESGDVAFYGNLLDLLTERNKLDPEKLYETAAFLSANQLPANENFAKAMLAQYSGNTQINFLPTVLHVSALSGSAENYRQTIEAIFNLWKQKKFENMSADRLITLFESHYRLLPGNKKASGAGFLLKEKLENIRREVLGK